MFKYGHKWQWSQSKSDVKTVDRWNKIDKTTHVEAFLWNIGLNMVIKYPSDIFQIVSNMNANDHNELFTK